MSIQTVLNNTHTLTGLIPIAERLEAKLSFWGRSYVVLNSENGEPNFNDEAIAPLDALLNRIFEVIWESEKIPRRRSMATDNFSSAEHEECRRLEKVMNRLCSEDYRNVKENNIITKIIVIIRDIFQPIFQHKWYDLKGGCNGQILARTDFTVWDNNLQQYVPMTEINKNLWMTI